MLYGVYVWNGERPHTGNDSVKDIWGQKNIMKSRHINEWKKRQTRFIADKPVWKGQSVTPTCAWAHYCPLVETICIYTLLNQEEI